MSAVSPQLQRIRSFSKVINAKIDNYVMDVKSVNRLFVTGAFVCMIFTLLLASCREHKEIDNTDSGRSMGEYRPSPPRQNADGPSNLRKPNHIDLNRQQELERFATGWDNVSQNVIATEIFAEQKEISLAAVAKLGGSDELLKMLDFLDSNGASALKQELLNGPLGCIFTGERAKEAREWLLTVQDAKLREKLFRLAGEGFSGIGFKEYFEQSGAAGHNCQAALLTGYCVTLAKTDPAAAVRVYQEFGYPKRIDNTGMADVVAAFPPTADFLKFATETRADSFTLAKRTRAALLANWAGVKPEQAAQYVVSDTANVHPDQMGVVVRKWAETNPEGARGWLEKAPAVPARDDGWAALAEHWVAKGEIVKAWQNVGQVSDFDRKVKLATEVFKEWEKKDQAAAVKAWEELFPPAR